MLRIILLFSFIFLSINLVFAQDQQISVGVGYVKPSYDGNSFTVQSDAVLDVLKNFKLLPFVGFGKAEKSYRNQYGTTFGTGITGRYYFKNFFVGGGINYNRFSISDVSNSTITEAGYTKTLLRPRIDTGVWLKVTKQQSYLVRAFYDFKGIQRSVIHGYGQVTDNSVKSKGVDFTYFYTFKNNVGVYGKATIVSHSFFQPTGNVGFYENLVDTPIAVGVFYRK